MREADQKGLSTRSEAVYTDCVSDDGARGAVLRLCRYPDAGFAWAWGHVFADGSLYAFTHHELACDGAHTDLAHDPVRYALSWESGAIELARTGSRDAPRHAEARLRCAAHAHRHPGHGAGTLPLEVEAQFRPASRTVSNLEGRTEVLGTAAVRVRVEGRDIEITGRGQFHEQVQTDPRFTQPFSYLTLRGPELGLIAIRGARGARGWLLRTAAAEAVARVRLSPPGSERMIAVELAKGGALAGELTTTCDYSVPVYDGYRPGSFVAGRLGGVPVTGCVNDFLLDALAFDREPFDTPR